MHLRYAGICRVCDAALPATAEAIYERETKTVRCVRHEVQEVSSPIPSGADQPPAREADAVDVGMPGASARREFDRRRIRREERIRTAHPRIGGLIHALTDDPQSTRAWDVGAVGEERLGRRLNELASETLGLLHDRRIPGTRANIDHLAVTPTGVYVIDAKKYRGRPHLKVEGGFLRSRVEKLLVGTRDCNRLVDGVTKQVTVVGDHLPEPVPVHGVLCFVEADWPLIGGSFTTRGVEVLWPRKLYPKLMSDGPIDVETIAFLHHTLATALPPA
jgi:Nuclease-related domain